MENKILTSLKFEKEIFDKDDNELKNIIHCKTENFVYMFELSDKFFHIISHFFQKFAYKFLFF